MRYMLGVVAACLLAGCAGSPDKPPLPQGEYRPINIPTTKANLDVFDFFYEGDIVGVLPALKAVAPQLNIMPTLGQATPLPVRLNLKGVGLEQALRAIGAQGGGVADVVWNTTRNQGGNQVFIRFHTPVKAKNKGESNEQ